MGTLALEDDGGVLHRHLRAEVAVDPLHRRVFFGHGTLGDEVVDVVRPVLDRRVAAAAALLDENLDDRRVQRVRRVGRRGAAFDVVHVGTLVDDDQRALKLAHVLCIDAEVGLQRLLDPDARWDVDEGATRPDGRVERRELVVGRRNDRGEVLAEEVLVLKQCLAGIEEQDALVLELLLERVVDDLRLVLGTNAGEKLSLRFGDPQALEGVLDRVGHVVPRARVALGGLEVVEDVVEIDPAEVGAPIGHRLREEDLVGVKTEVEHPLGLTLVSGDLTNHVLVEAALDLDDRVLLVVETPFVFA